MQRSAPLPLWHGKAGCSSLRGKLQQSCGTEVPNTGWWPLNSETQTIVWPGCMARCRISKANCQQGCSSVGFALNPKCKHTHTPYLMAGCSAAKQKPQHWCFLCVQAHTLVSFELVSKAAGKINKKKMDFIDWGYRLNRGSCPNLCSKRMHLVGSRRSLSRGGLNASQDRLLTASLGSCSSV